MSSSVVGEGKVLCGLLSARENALIATLLRPHCKAVASTVAQLFFASDVVPQALGWKYEGCGVVCLTEDHSKQSFFLRLYCVKRAKLLWEQELYTPFKYSAPRPFFHTFPADDCQAGLNFADEKEAEAFNAAVARCVHRIEENLTGQTQLTRSNSQNFSSGIDCELDQARSQTSVPAESEEPNCGKSTRSTAVMSTKLGSKTLPRSTSLLALRKGPLPPVPSFTRASTLQIFRGQSSEPLPTGIPAPPCMPAPLAPDRIRKSSSFNTVGSPSAAESDLILTALRDAIRKRHNLCHSEMDTDEVSQL